MGLPDVFQLWFLRAERKNQTGSPPAGDPAGTPGCGQPPRKTVQIFKGHSDPLHVPCVGSVHIPTDDEILPAGIAISEGPEVSAPEPVCGPLALDGDGRLSAALQHEIDLVTSLSHPR